MVDREAWDALAVADDATRVARLLDCALALEQSAARGDGLPNSARRAGLLIRLIADADLVANGLLRRRFVADSDLEPVVGPVLDRMAATRDISGRARLLEQLCALIEDEDTAETIACLPYAPGMVGWRVETYLARSPLRWPAAYRRARRAARYTTDVTVGDIDRSDLTWEA